MVIGYRHPYIHDSGYTHPYQKDGMNSVPPNPQSSLIPTPEEIEEIRLYCEEARNQCDCSCHSSPFIMHIVPCCCECRYCRLRIRRGGMEKHVKKLHPDKVEECGGKK